MVGVGFVVNRKTSPGHWGVEWVVFGKVIALVHVWFRALRVVLAGAGRAAAAYMAHRWWTRREAPGPAATTATGDAVSEFA